MGYFTRIFTIVYLYNWLISHFNTIIIETGYLYI